jgi:ABC-type sulfate transport system permease subunit
MGKAAFIASILLNAGLASFIVTASMGPLFSMGERWLGVVFVWVLALPLMVLFAMRSGSRSYQRYLAAPSTVSRIKLYLVQVIWIPAVSMLTVATLFWVISRAAT